MQKADAAAFLANLGKPSEAASKSPTNIHIISGEVGTASSDGFASVSVDGLVFSEEDDQFVEMAALGGLEEGDLASVLLIGEAGKSQIPLVLGSVGGIDRIRDSASAAGALAEAANAVITALNQFFWHDENGAHVSTDENDPDGEMNSIWNSYGLLFRTFTTNLLGLVVGESGETPGVVIYDGNGNAASNISASFIGNLIELGRNSLSSVISFCSGSLKILAQIDPYDGYVESFIESEQVFNSGSRVLKDLAGIKTSVGGRPFLSLFAEPRIESGGEFGPDGSYAAINIFGGHDSVTSGIAAFSDELSFTDIGNGYSGYYAMSDVIKKLNAETIQATGSYSISTAGIDNLKNGPHISVPAGKWLIFGAWIFNTSSGSERNIQVALRSGASGSAWGEKHRVFTKNNYAELTIAVGRSFTSTTEVYLAGSSSVTSDAATCYITAIRLK